MCYSSKTDLANFLRMLGQSNSSKRVRVVGSGHSWSTIALSDDMQISMANFKVCVCVYVCMK